jgi:hypothetical protein
MAAQRPEGTELQPGEQDYTGPDGTRSATLLRVSDPVTEPSTFPGSKKTHWTHRTWTFAIDDGSEFDGQIMQRRAAVVDSNSDKSTQYEIINALAGKTVPVGATLSISKHLVLRSCFIRIVTENEYPRIAQFMAKPEQAPAAVKAQPVAEAALPF